MPTLLEEKEIILEWTDLDKRVSKTKAARGPRSSGIHLSGIIRPTLEIAGYLDIYDQSEDMPLVVMLGMFFEEGIVTLYPDMIWQPGEVVKDGIVGSPDGLTEGPPLQLEEFKFTTKSQYTRQGELILQEKLWMWQLSGYCHMMGITQARLHVFWSRGNYREKWFPVYYTYTISFTEAELDKFWRNVILKNKGLAKPETH